MQTERIYLLTSTEKRSNHEFLLEQMENYQGGRNFMQRPSRGRTTWKVMLKSALKDIVNWRTKKTEQLFEVSTHCLDDHHFKKGELESVGELSKVCSQIVLKCFFLARIGGLDILWSVNKLARPVTKWTRASDKRWARLISYSSHK